MEYFELAYGLVAVIFTISAISLSQRIITLSNIKTVWTFMSWSPSPLHKIPITPPNGVSDADIEEVTVRKESPFSNGWWSDDKIFQLERRALFSKSWNYTTHSSRFTKPGDYITFSLASFSFFVILGKDMKIRAFHNVCRHRAYEVTRKECGSSKVLGCRYHGWSYDTMGKLIKAPEFEGVNGFDKSANSLWEVKTKVLGNGMVFVNLDASLMVDEAENATGQEVENFSIPANYQLVEEWKFDGKFNWKIVGDAFQSLSLALPKTGLRSTFSSIGKGIFASQTQKQVDLFPATTLLYSPASSILLSIKLLPESATKTTVQCDIYSNAPQTAQSVVTVIKDLQLKLSLKIYELDILQKTLSNSASSLRLGQLIRQETIHSMLNMHLKLERVEGRELQPALRVQSLSLAGKADDDLCRELEKEAINSRSVGPEKNKARGMELDW